MKRLFLAVAALVLCVSMSFAQEVEKSEIPFNAEMKALASYLELGNVQLEKVADFNELFVQEQSKALAMKPSKRNEGLVNALNMNLMLMKGALNEVQYKKYLTIINLTNHNREVLAADALSQNYLVKK